MKSFTILAVVAGVAMAQESLSSCAQMCVNNMNRIANTDLSCAAGDVGCFCTKSNWAYGVRDCTLQACGASESAQAISYAAGLCNGVTPSGSNSVPAALPILTNALGTASGIATAPASQSTAITTQALVATTTNSDGSVQTTTTGFSTVYSSISGSAASGASSAASSVRSSVASEASSAASALSSGLSSIAASLSSALESATGSAGSAASSATSRAASAASSAASAASSAAASATSQAAAPKMTGMPIAAGVGLAAWLLI